MAGFEEESRGQEEKEDGGNDEARAAELGLLNGFLTAGLDLLEDFLALAELGFNFGKRESVGEVPDVDQDSVSLLQTEPGLAYFNALCFSAGQQGFGFFIGRSESGQHPPHPEARFMGFCAGIMADAADILTSTGQHFVRWPDNSVVPMAGFAL
jgi:hypothetical protein